MGTPLRVLIVEDNEDDALLMLRVLREGGYVPSSSRVDTAIALAVALETQPWDLALCDYTLPHYNGEDALALIRSRKPNLPVIFVTGTIGEEVTVRLVKAGASDYVLKDRMARLPVAVEQALREAVDQRLHEDTRRALYDTSEQLAGILDAATDAIIEADAAGTIKLANAAAHRLFGWDLGTLLNQRFAAIVPPEHREHSEGGPQRFLEAGGSTPPGQSVEVTGLRRDGTTVCCELSISAVRHKSGEERFVGVLRNVTERKRAEETLRASEKQFRQAVECLPIGICITDFQEHVLLVNEKFSGLFGYTRHDIPSLTDWWSRACPDEDHRKRAMWEWRHAAQQALDSGTEIEPQEWAVTCKDGSQRDILLGASCITRQWLLTFVDITERKHAEVALQRANEQLAALINASPLGITVLDRNGRVSLWNLAAEAMFGWTSAEVIGRPLPTVPPDQRQEHETLRTRALNGECLTGIELTRMKKNGTPLTMALYASPLRDADGTVTAVLGIMADVTQVRQIEHHTRRLDHLALLGQLMGGISHEIKNPLFVMTGYVQLLKDRIANKEYGDLQEDLDKIEASAKRISQTVQRFLSIARPAPPARELCAVPAILQQTLDFLRHELLTNQVGVETRFAPDLPSIPSDPRLLQEVFLNLVMNAVQAMREAHGKGMLTVKVELSAVSDQPSDPAERWIEVRIQDDGPGVAPEHRAKLFEPFFTTKPVGQGTGLGLWTVRSNLTTLGGTVTCETEVGQGATFIVRLPVGERLLSPSS